MSRVALWRSLRAHKGIGARAVRRLDESPCTGFLPVVSQSAFSRT
jgi:hypothetical protein